MELTNDSRFKYMDMAVTLRKLLLLNPESFKSQFIANNSYILSEEALESVKKIRNRTIKAKIIALDTYRKKIAKDRKENELYNSSDNLMMGNCSSRELSLRLSLTTSLYF